MTGAAERFLQAREAHVSASVDRLAEAARALTLEPPPDLTREILPVLYGHLSTGRSVVLATTPLPALMGDETATPTEPQAQETATPTEPQAQTTAAPKKKHKRRKKGTCKGDPVVENVRETRWTVAPFKNDDMAPLPAHGIVVYPDGDSVLVHDFLGDMRDELIKVLHDPSIANPLPPLPHTSPQLRLHPWQLTGAKKMVESCMGPMRAVLNSSQMGTGKTKETLIALEYSRLVLKMKGSFDLILPPRSCLGQWAEEVESTFAPGQRPRVHILRNSNTTAIELLKGEYDLVITTYHFLYNSAKRTIDFQKFLALVQEMGVDAAKQEAKKRRWPTKRPVAALFSEIFVRQPFRHVVCDEVHLIKNINGLIHKAVRSLRYEAIIMLSGTPFLNRLTDGMAYIDLLPAEPFQSTADIARVFGNDQFNQGLETLQPSRLARYVKYLLSFAYGNTNESLNLPPCHDDVVLFEVSHESEVRITYQVQRFIEALTRTGTSTVDLGEEGGASRDIMKLATYARSIAWLEQVFRRETTDRKLEMSNAVKRARMIFKAHVNREHDRFNLNSNDGMDDGGLGLRAAYTDGVEFELPNWAAMEPDLVASEGEGVPSATEDVLIFFEKFLEWYRDPIATGQRPQVVARLIKDGVALPMPRVQKKSSKKEKGSRHATTETATKEKGNGPLGAGAVAHDSMEGVAAEGGASEEIELLNLSNLDAATALSMSTAILQDEASEHVQENQQAESRRREFQKLLRLRPTDELESSRMKAAMEVFRKIREDHPEHKVVIWSQSVQFLDVLAELMSRPENGSTQSFRFDGDLDDFSRKLVKDDFKKGTPDRPLIMSAGAGGNGLNLAFANHVILCEPLWNVQDENQIIDRCHRQPQKKPVFVYRLFGANSAVDLMIKMSSMRKWAIIQPVMEQICRKEGVKLQVPKIAKWFTPLNIQDKEM